MSVRFHLPAWHPQRVELNDEVHARPPEALVPPCSISYLALIPPEGAPGEQTLDAVRDLERLTHKTIRRVTDDLERFKFNTALAALMEFTNGLNAAWERKAVDSAAWGGAMEKLLVLMAPMAPHVAEELWERTGRPYSIHNQPWPQWDPNLAADEVITLVVQVNGRVRDRITVSADISEAEARRLALESQRIRPYVDGKTIDRVVYVPGKLVNIVVK